MKATNPFANKWDTKDPNGKLTKAEKAAIFCISFLQVIMANFEGCPFEEAIHPDDLTLYLAALEEWKKEDPDEVKKLFQLLESAEDVANRDPTAKNEFVIKLIAPINRLNIMVDGDSVARTYSPKQRGL